MPGMSGFELARAIHGKNPMMSVVIMLAVTGPGEGDLPDNAVFLAKPTIPAMIVDAVNRAVIGTLTARTTLSGSEAASPESSASGEDPTIDPFDPLSIQGRRH